MMKLDAMVGMLSSKEYSRFDHVKLMKPEFTPIEELRDTILCGPGASYTYLLQLSDYKKSSEQLAKYQDKLALAESRLLELKARGHLELWKAELDELEAVVLRGHKTRWTYDEPNKYKFA
jgi:hypothetical protein